LFSEAPSRAVVCVRPERAGEVMGRAEAASVPATVLGESGGDRLVVEGLVDVGLDEASRRWRDAIPSALAE
jgi:phosphoribosylformylglycinamidine synthase